MAEKDQQEKFQTALCALAEQQKVLLEQQNEIMRKLADQGNLRIKKDLWDRIGAIAPILSGTIIAIGGAYFTVAYNQAQLKLQEAQTIEKFIPHLLGDEKSKRAAILAISSLTDAKMAARVAAIFASPGTVSALESIAENDTSSDRKALKGALARALDNMAESYRMDKRYEEALGAYKKALNLQEQSIGPKSTELIPNLNRIAELYTIHKNYAEAEAQLKRAGEILKSSYGADSTQYAAGLRKLSQLYKEEGLESKAQSILAQAVAIEQKLPSTSSGVALGTGPESAEESLQEPSKHESQTAPNTTSSAQVPGEKSPHQETSTEPRIMMLGPEPAGKLEAAAKQIPNSGHNAQQESAKQPEPRNEDSELSE